MLKLDHRDIAATRCMLDVLFVRGSVKRVSHLLGPAVVLIFIVAIRKRREEDTWPGLCPQETCYRRGSISKQEARDVECPTELRL